MSAAFAERFARYLAKEDVRRLFAEVLVRSRGSIVKACEAAGVERRTFYNWRRARDVSLGTKVKVLRAAYEADPHSTLWLVARALRRRAGEALLALLDRLRSEAVGSEGREEFLERVELLRRALRELGGPLAGEVASEVEDIKQSLELKAAELGVEPSELWPEEYARWSIRLHPSEEEPSD